MIIRIAQFLIENAIFEILGIIPPRIFLLKDLYIVEWRISLRMSRAWISWQKSNSSSIFQKDSIGKNIINQNFLYFCPSKISNAPNFATKLTSEIFLIDYFQINEFSV